MPREYFEDAAFYGFKDRGYYDRCFNSRDIEIPGPYLRVGTSFQITQKSMDEKTWHAFFAILEKHFDTTVSDVFKDVPDEQKQFFDLYKIFSYHAGTKKQHKKQLIKEAVTFIKVLTSCNEVWGNIQQLASHLSVKIDKALASERFLKQNDYMNSCDDLIEKKESLQCEVKRLSKSQRDIDWYFHHDPCLDWADGLTNGFDNICKTVRLIVNIDKTHQSLKQHASNFIEDSTLDPSKKLELFYNNLDDALPLTPLNNKDQTLLHLLLEHKFGEDLDSSWNPFATTLEDCFNRVLKKLEDLPKSQRKDFLNKPDSKGNTAMDYALAHRMSGTLVAQLEAAGADLDFASALQSTDNKVLNAVIAHACQSDEGIAKLTLLMAPMVLLKWNH